MILLPRKSKRGVMYKEATNEPMMVNTGITMTSHTFTASNTSSLEIVYIPGGNMIETVFSSPILSGGALCLVGLQPLDHLLFLLPRLHRLQDDVSVGFRIGSD